MRRDTALIHAGEPHPRIEGAVSLPIFQSSTFEVTGDGGAYGDIRYLRLSNAPNHKALHEKLAAVESGEDGLVTASGMAAISATLLSLLRSGDHLLAHRTLYGGTHGFLTRDLGELGIDHGFVDANDRDGWERALRPKTKVFYVETFTNPLLEVLDLDGVVAFCREHGLVSVIDNTLATPINFRPLERGFDLVVHSATKYLNGHSDIVAGAIVGSKERVQRVKAKLDHFGGSLDPHACFLLHRGMKTLALRVRHQNASALAVARFLEGHPGVARVNYPGLESHPKSERAKALFPGHGGLLSFELAGGLDAAHRFLTRAALAIHAPSLGGPETLMTRPAATSHAGLPPEERRGQGISDGLLRLSIGLEATEDLIDDFARALLAS